MRKFKRVAPPSGWPEKQIQWNQQWVDLLQNNAQATFSWYQHEGKSANVIALPHLKSQTQEHCSFCDGFPLAGISLETVEHFRPKCRGKFPQHAYSWDNLYYCCSHCQSQKGEKWDEGLLAPDAEDYTFERYFEFDFTTGQMRPSTTASAPDQQRAETTRDIYDLDSATRRRLRKLELWKFGKMAAEDRKLDEFAYRDYLESAPPHSPP